jgi:hypothetical protein
MPHAATSATGPVFMELNLNLQLRDPVFSRA